MKNILVTGAAGFIGQHLVKQLITKGYRPRCLVLNKDDSTYLRSLDVDLVMGDVTQPNSLRKALIDINTVYHLVGVGSIGADSNQALAKFRKINVEGTRNLIKFCQNNPQIKKFIYFSSFAAMGVIKDKTINELTSCQPKTPYEISKYESEQVLLQYQSKVNFPIFIIRPAMVYGEGARHSDIFTLASFLKKRFCPIIGDGENIVPLVYVKDLVRTAIVLGEKDIKQSSTFIIAREDSVSYNRLVHTIEDALGVKSLIIHFPKKLAKFIIFILCSFFKFFKKDFLLSPRRIDSMTSNRLYNVSKAKKGLNFHSTDFNKSIKATIKWYRELRYL